MKIVGIIVEYNPFHNGHIKHLSETRKLSGADVIIAVMSANYVQRGDLSMINKFDKTTIALEHDVDLVIELPFIHSNQAADYFGYEAVKILNMLGVNEIYYGSESDGKVDVDEVAFFDKAKSLAKNLFSNDVQSNDILGNAYKKAIVKLNSSIVAKSILRVDDINTESATRIRENYLNKIDNTKYLPSDSISKIKPINYDLLYSMLKHTIITHNNLSNIVGSEEGLYIRASKMIKKANCYEQFVELMKSKKHSKYRIQRFCMNILLNITSDDVLKCRQENYIRILGFNEKGQKYLSNIKKDLLEKEIKPLMSLKNNDKHTSEIEIRATEIFTMLTSNDYKMDLNPPVIKC